MLLPLLLEVCLQGATHPWRPSQGHLLHACCYSWHPRHGGPWHSRCCWWWASIGHRSITWGTPRETSGWGPRGRSTGVTRTCGGSALSQLHGAGLGRCMPCGLGC